jgi:hypothetical protein
MNPAAVTGDDVAICHRELVAQYEVGTVAVKLAAIGRLYEAAVWRRLRQDNPADGLKAPKDKTKRSKCIKFPSVTWSGSNAVYRDLECAKRPLAYSSFEALGSISCLPSRARSSSGSVTGARQVKSTQT